MAYPKEEYGEDGLHTSDRREPSYFEVPVEDYIVQWYNLGGFNDNIGVRVFRAEDMATNPILYQSDSVLDMKDEGLHFAMAVKGDRGAIKLFVPLSRDFAELADKGTTKVRGSSQEAMKRIKDVYPEDFKYLRDRALRDGDSLCEVCGEPWEIYYVREEFTPSERSMFFEGKGCPACDGNWSPDELDSSYAHEEEQEFEVVGSITRDAVKFDAYPALGELTESADSISSEIDATIDGLRELANMAGDIYSRLYSTSPSQRNRLDRYSVGGNLMACSRVAKILAGSIEDEYAIIKQHIRASSNMYDYFRKEQGRPTPIESSKEDELLEEPIEAEAKEIISEEQIARVVKEVVRETLESD